MALVCVEPWGLIGRLDAGESPISASTTEGVVEGSVGDRSTSELRHLIEQLGSSTYRVRHAAFLRLWESAGGGDRKEVMSLIDEATQSTDIDVASSAKWLRRMMQLTASPAEAAQMVEELVLIRSGDMETVLRLARNHRWDHLLALLSSLSDVDRARLLSESESLAGPRSSLLAMAWSDNQQHRIPDLVDQLWTVSEAIEARCLWRKLGLEEWSRRPPSLLIDGNSASIDSRLAPPFPSPLSRMNRSNAFARWEFAMAEGEGEKLKALLQAKDAGQHELAESLAMQSGLWEHAVPPIASRPPQRGSSTTGQSAVDAARVALLLRWSGDDGLSQQWIESIGMPGPRDEDVAGVLLALCLCDRVDQALELAKKRSPDEAYDCLIRRGRVEEALKCLGLDSIDEVTVKRWTDSLIDEAPGDKQSDTQTTARLAAVGTLFARLGLTEIARIVDQACIHWASSISSEHRGNRSENLQRGPSSSKERWTELFEAWSSQHRRTFALAQLKQLLREGIDEELRDSLLRALYRSREIGNDVHRLAGPSLLWFRQQRAGDWEQAVDDLESLFSGREPDRWPNRWREDGLVSLGTHLLRSESSEEDGDVSMALARIALFHQRSDLAKAWLIAGAERGFPEWMSSVLDGSTDHVQRLAPSTERSPISAIRMALLGEILIFEKDYRRAVIVFERLVKMHPERVDLALRSAHWMKAIGENELAAQVRLQALSIPLSPLQIRLAVGGLDKEQLYDDSEFLLRQALRHPSNSEIDDLRFAFQLSAIQHNRLSESATQKNGERFDPSYRAFLDLICDDDRRQLLSRLKAYPSFSFEVQYSLVAVESLHRLEARQAILDGDREAADRAVQACYAANPDQIETLIELVPLAEERLGKELVDRWISLYAETLEAQLRKWPDDTLVGNNLAWLYANVERRIERAKELSEHVATLLPDDSIYLDTLAEVEFRSGNVDRAIELSSRCRALTPLETHHRTQLYRFLKAQKF